jgi:hypothetical protein
MEDRLTREALIKITSKAPPILDKEAPVKKTIKI